jgi:hypothetical protein
MANKKMRSGRVALTPGFICLLACQCSLAVVAVIAGYSSTTLSLGWLALSICACWAATMLLASAGMIMQKPRAYLVGMICHLLLAITASVHVILFACLALSDPQDKILTPMFVLFALMWLPFAAIPAWAFFYLRKLRTRLFCSD